MPPLDDKEVPACLWIERVRNFMCVRILEPPAGYKYISVVMTDGHVRNPPKTVLYISPRKLSVQGQVKSRDPGSFESFKFISGF